MSNYTSILAMLMKLVDLEMPVDLDAIAHIYRLRQCVDHPLLVLSKMTEEDGAEDKLLELDSADSDNNGDTTGSLRDMIAQYAGAAISNKSDTNGTDVHDGGDNTYALKVLKEISEAEGTSECMICTSEIFDEVLLPCYHRG